MNDTPQPIDAGTVKFLRVLVTVLTVVMIAGVLVIIALLVIRLSEKPPALPDVITLPSGAQATAFTQGTSWFAVVTSDDRILIYNRQTGQLMQDVKVEGTSQ
ncbi:DUF6476 family protein [Rhodalgimonas zhirmunskyi]|uniref:DUF6476 family protein n=1 Tax=Rhodalgimonas zhirmunskyi TaxID=2964767 RepID=A0AAJ1UBI3_9RHOB|nr:DUF6476 family protein [Rhodoalgimonas zhirmunskyi]MDQ2093536.1 DUF6476 family protein [Rhodoalgimonas zhirmunskyi]